MSVSPAITIGIMTRNYGCYLAQAIESVLSQKRSDWELFISDDASSDDTPEVVAPYLSDPRIHYIRHEQNLGQANNWRCLLSQGTAPILTVLHADDYWLPETLAAVLAAFQSSPQLDILYGNWYRAVNGVLETRPYKQEAAHQKKGTDEFRYQITHHTWLPSATFLSRSVVEAAGWPNPELKMLVDTEYFLRASLQARVVQCLPQPLIVYRVHSGNATAEGSFNGLLTEEKERMPDIIAAEVTAHPCLKDCINLMRRHNARLIFNEGISQIALSHPETGRALIKRAIQLAPSLLVFSPKLLPDYILSQCGSLSLFLIRHLHKRRFYGT